MLTSLVVAFLLGVLHGDLFAVKLWLYEYLRFLIPLIFLLAFVAYMRRGWRLTSSSLVIGSAFLWGLIHNPPAMTSKVSIGQVIWVSGCSPHHGDLLVSVNDRIYRTTGGAGVGDLVELNGSPRWPRVGVVEQNQSPDHTTLWCLVGRWVRSHVLQRIIDFPVDIAAWFRAFILGEQRNLEQESLETFRRIGLLHLLVLSGSHLSVLATLIHFVLKLPWHIFYIFGRLSAVTWLRVSDISVVISAGVLAMYSAAAGLSQSLQRALLGFVARFIPPMVGISRSAHWTLLLTILFQAILFPVNFLSITMLMSWSGVLVLSVFTGSAFRKPIWNIILDAGLIQCIFFVLSLLFFGEVGILAIPANLFFHMVFAALLPLDVVGLLCSWHSFDQMLIRVNRRVLSWIDSVHQLQDSMPLQQVLLPSQVTVDVPLGKALVMFLLVGLFVLTRWRQGDLQSMQPN